MKTAEFEEGRKNPITAGIHKSLIVTRPLLSRHIPEIADFCLRPFQSHKIRYLKDVLLSKTAEIDPNAARLILENMIFFPRSLFLRASPFHIDNWLRDSFYTCMALNEPEVEMHILGNFTNDRSRHFPQPPTTRLLFTNRQWFFDDECNALSLVWRGKLAQMGVDLTEREKPLWQARLELLRKPVEEGNYVTSTGTEKSWFDTFVFPKPDVLSYNQGIYVVALMMADKMGLKLQRYELKQAIQRYEDLAPEGRLHFSAHFNYKDVSSLMGEFLANRLLKESILPSKNTHVTVESLDPGGGGYKIVTKADGSFLDPSEFNSPYQPGDYQNGANWMLFSAVAREAGENNGLPFDQRFWENTSYYLYVTNNPEYERTDSRKISWNQTRENHAWNALVHVLIKEALAKKAIQLLRV